MRRFYILLSALFLIVFIGSIFASSNTEINYNKNIRIGLKELYENVDSISIANDTLVLGYEIEGKYHEEYTLKSNNGFKITPAANIFLVSIQTFNSFEECEAKIKDINNLGYIAYPGSIINNTWKIFISNTDAANEKQNIKGIEFEEKNDNGLRTLLSYNEESSIILDNSLSHSLFATKSLTKGVEIINLGERSYRGKIEIGRYNKKGLTAVNVILLEEYLYGVLPSEMPSYWPKEALKAQAVSARSFALYYLNISKYPNEPYTLCDTTFSQVYKGFSGENDLCNQAINETRNQVIYAGDSIIPAYFFSSSGGHTEDSQNVWSGRVSYLKGVPDIYEIEPTTMPWTKSITKVDIENILKKNNINIGEIKDVQVTSYSDSGRAMGLKIIGTTGEYELVKETMRSWLGLRSRKFTLVKSNYIPPENYSIVDSKENIKTIHNKVAYIINGTMETNTLNTGNDQLIIFTKNNIKTIPTISGEKDTYIFVGQGNGHGVGMSQSGAKGMANEGFTYKEILEYYFTGAVVK